MPPLKEEYRDIDNLQPNPTLRQIAKMLPLTFTKALMLYPGAAILLYQGITSPLASARRRRADRKLIRENPLFDYGAATSIRELATSTSYTHYFQKLDREMYFKVVERQILESITEFLDAHDIDTSDLRERQDTILNNGVIVTGGSVKAKALTVGERAKSFVDSVTKTTT